MTRWRLHQDSWNLLHRAVLGGAVVVLILAVAGLSLRIAYGALDEDWTLHVDVARAGQGVNPGTEVVAKGVPVGSVIDVELQDSGQVGLTLELEPEIQVPVGSQFQVRSKTLFGEKELAILYPDTEGEAYADGDRVSGRVSIEAEELVDVTDRLLRAIDPEDVARFTLALSEAVRGQGNQLRSTLDSTRDLTHVLADTVDDQQQLWAAATEFSTLLTDVMPDLQDIASDGNILIPTLLAHEGDFRRILRSTEELSRTISAVLPELEPDLARLIRASHPVLDVVVQRSEDLRALLHGLERYLRGAGDGRSLETLPDGGRFGYFSLLMYAEELQELFCGTFAVGGEQFSPIAAAFEDVTGLSCESPTAAEPEPPAEGRTGRGGSEEPGSLLDRLQRPPASPWADGVSRTDGLFGGGEH